MAIIEVSQVPEKEKVYLKKDFLGWRVVQPIKDPETGKLSWFNILFGGKRGLFNLAILFVIISLLYVGMNELIGSYREIAENPCTFCKECFCEQVHPDIDFNKVNISETAIEGVDDIG